MVCRRKFGVAKEEIDGSDAKLDNEELGRLKEVNIDEASARRHVRDSLKDVQLNLDHILFKTPETGIKTKELEATVKEDKEWRWLLNGMSWRSTRAASVSL
ncbi:unnamed protein product [Arabidopsis lyrata]|uniref:Uncharacterized protein n=1 Tax=Arabidopsis lyrata subsp. lyrata TaxID=81972 RepID=D7M092_ARALL|nr:hypothetical protein ARALYDRAFT_911538 [Arabidopsis lyrata subsp. lyrata]CAH8273013.1 unnamed protein product [Arabidopsis lyrata]